MATLLTDNSQVASPQYGAWGQTSSHPQIDPMMAALLGHLTQPQQGQSNQMAAFLAAMRPHPAVHLGIGGAEMTPENPYGNTGGDPFTNGFFRNSVHAQQNGGGNSGVVPIDSAAIAATRQQIQGMPGMLPMTQVQNQGRQVADPFDGQGGILPGVDMAHLAGYQPSQAASSFGFPMSQGKVGGMINPQLPDAQKYTDSNFWSAVGQMAKPQPRLLARTNQPFPLPAY